ncbi:interleukin 10 [Chelydra serpentina]|uniref:Interleukin family protein n=2 Tax=Chelydra serpentina TaxID=8475 RepID=A0A8C3RJG4_CHESE|nr:interleukin 10 [Chelydra serpentina]
MKLLTALIFLALIASIKLASCQLSEESCTQLSNLLPLRLKNLRIAFDEIKDYFQAKDDELDILLLKEDLLEDFKGYLGCQSVSDMIRFYLDEVLPKAINSSKHIKRSVGNIGNMLMDLRQTLKRCHRFFTCEKRSRTLKQITETYDKLQEKGIYKAMGEFDIFINYIEEYLMMKMGK